jgi:hypothetical protein
MMASPLEISDFLIARWRGLKSVLMALAAAGSDPWQRWATIDYVGDKFFRVLWEDDGSESSFSFDPLEWVGGIAEGGNLFFLTSRSGDRLTVCERPKQI